MPRQPQTEEQKKAFADRMKKWRDDHKNDEKKPRVKKQKKSNADQYEKRGDTIIMNSSVTFTKRQLEQMLKQLE